MYFRHLAAGEKSVLAGRVAGWRAADLCRGGSSDTDLLVVNLKLNTRDGGKFADLQQYHDHNDDDNNMSLTSSSSLSPLAPGPQVRMALPSVTDTARRFLIMTNDNGDDNDNDG